MSVPTREVPASRRAVSPTFLLGRMPNLRRGGSIFLIAAILGQLTLFSTPQMASADTPGEWTGSVGPGTGAGVVNDGLTGPAQYQYFHNPAGFSMETWTFSRVANNPGTVHLEWTYTGFHAYFQVRVGLTAFVAGSLPSTQTLVNDGPVNCCTPPSGGFTYTGTVDLEVGAGDIYGFQMSGQNGDSNNTLSGTLTVVQPTLYVEQTNAIGGGSCQNPDYNTIADAVAAVSVAGTAIHLCDGVYDQTATVEVPIEMTFSGDGAGSTVIDGSNGSSPILLFDAAEDIHFVGLTLRDAGGTSLLSQNGGAVRAGGNVTVANSTFQNNSNTSLLGAHGGAIYASGDVTVTNSSFLGNSVANLGASGGAIYSPDGVFVTNSDFSGNHVDFGGGGGAIEAGSTSVVGSTFSANVALGGAGGAILGNATISDSTFYSNQANVGGAIGANGSTSVNVTNSTFSGNIAGTSGGAIGNGTATIASSTFKGNTAGSPGLGETLDVAGATVANSIFSSAATNCGGPSPTTAATSARMRAAGSRRPRPAL